MRFSVLSSGSKANSTFVEASGTRILIDCGLSCKEAERRLTSIGVDPMTIDGIIITHEHSDHLYGVSAFSRRHRTPVFANSGTAKHLKKVHHLEKFKTGMNFWVGGLDISPFSIVHDAADPVGFAVQAEGLKFVQLTDLGRITPVVTEAVRGANAMVLESNHDQEMLRCCDYPWQLKQRISSSHGHLSNDTAGTFLLEMMHSELLHVVLGHLSENSNTPQLAMETVMKYVEISGPKNILPACVAQNTPLFEVGEMISPAGLDPEYLARIKCA